MATSYNPNSSPRHDDSSRLYAVAVVVSVAIVFFLLKARHCPRLDKEAQEAEAAGLRRAAPASGGGDDTTVGPPAAAGSASSTGPGGERVTVEMALRSAEPVVCTYRKADGWAEATTCAVCLAELDDGVSVRVLPVCMHHFHAACVGEWLLAHHTCPLCRAPIDPAVAGAAA
ncbi:hypothetical protein BS78_K334300 [Paspalum vaginatum]|uniref:RING-type domain-containing protein n=1 Tax=Paspalum vaginatum TaxID=158149 RepID=A0A9W7XCZ1_9POAL|nr:hypothetical protein BS78_K334300 [Paspalum vaginatum]